LLFVHFVFDTCVNTLDAFLFCHLFFSSSFFFLSTCPFTWAT